MQGINSLKIMLENEFNIYCSLKELMSLGLHINLQTELKDKKTK